jgi:3-O-methylgallate 3,4-dioxygenase
MATITYALGSSHGPTNRTPPEEWPRLGEGDKKDPRFDFNSHLAKVRPGMEAELTLEKRQERGAALKAALGKLRDSVAAANVDIMVVVSNPHRIWPDDSQAVFGVMRSEAFAVAVPDNQPFNPDERFKGRTSRPKPKTVDRAGHPELANHLISGLIERGFDVACKDSLREGEAVDEAFGFIYDLLPEGSTTPVVPFMLSRYLPYQASAARCVALGKALRKTIESWDSSLTVGLMASGGLSHQLIDEELDARVVAGLTSGDLADLAELPRKQLNGSPGTPEILNWVTVASAMAPANMTLVDYVPAFRSLAGTGHGLTYGIWG